jgi:hypothetical protein
MVDAVDSFLNNAVDLYVQTVDYCQISTSQILTPVGAGIRQIKPKSGDVRQMSPDSGNIMPDSGQNAGDPAIWPESWTDSAIWPESWTDPAWILAGEAGILDGSGCSGRISGQDGRFPVNWLGSGRFVPDSCKVHQNPAISEFVYAKFKKIFFIL